MKRKSIVVHFEMKLTCDQGKSTWWSDYDLNISFAMGKIV